MNSSSRISTSRRQFLGSMGLTAVAFPSLIKAAGIGTKVHHACIGVGGMGWSDLQNFKSHSDVEIVALCDVDANHLERARKELPNARVYRDWRELLGKEADRVDSVNVTVPDHMHAAIGLAALRAGKHVYCQKPMCHDIAEVRAMNRVSAEKKLVTQLGTQAASGFGDRLAVHVIRGKMLGKITRLVLCSNRPNAIETYRLPGPRPAQGAPAPDHLNWDLWTGTAPVREFAPGIYHPAKWRAWQDFGTGWLGDIGCHIFDSVWKGLKLAPPISVSAKVQESWRDTPARRGDTWPQSVHVTWTFPGNEFTGGENLAVEWFDGLIFPPDEIQRPYHEAHPGTTYPTESSCVIGTEGSMILPNGAGPILLPKGKFADWAKPALEPRNHYHHFIDAIAGRAKNESHFQQTGPMTEAILLGTVAVRHPDTELKWDAAAMTVTNLPAADKLLRRSYRDGWKVAL